MVKFSAKYKPIITGILMGLSLSFIMSFTMTVVMVGFAPIFMRAWFNGFVIGSLVSIPTSLILGPIIAKVVESMIIDQ